VNLEHFASGEGLGAELAPGAPQPDVLNHAWRDHENRVGAWRLIETLDELSLPCAVLLNSATHGHAPELVVAHHAGRRNGRAWTDEFGAPILPAGGRGARVNPRIDGGHGGAEGQGTAPLALPLHRREPCHPGPADRRRIPHTLNWCSDEQPIWHATRHGPLMAIPYPQDVNDIPTIVARKDGAAQFAEMIVDDSEERLRQVRDGVAQVMGIALHPSTSSASPIASGRWGGRRAHMPPRAPPGG
jgi:hypothetical protein